MVDDAIDCLLVAKPFGMAGEAEPSGSTGEGQEEISATARTADVCELTARVAAVEEA